MELLRRCILVACTFLVASLGARAQEAVWTYHYDNQRTGLNTNETVLTPANVNSNTFGKLFSYPVDGYVYAEPLYLPGVNIQGRGAHNVLLICTEHDTVYAFDADSAGGSGGLLWSTNLGPSAVTTIPGVYTNRNFGTRYSNDAYIDIEPEVGITGTPVIDTISGTLYVDAFTGVVGGGVTNYYHTLHALNITNGTEQPGSPVQVTASVPGTGVDSVAGRVTFNPKQENQRAALTLAGGIVYLCYAGYADTDPYHGWIIGYNATNLVQLTNYVFNTTPNSTVAEFGANAGEGGIWMSGGGLAVDDNTNLYFATANGIFNVTNVSKVTEFGDCVMKLSTTNGLQVADYFAPWNQAVLQSLDQDLGSGGVLLLPDQTGPYPHELICTGKQGQNYIINRDQFTTNNGHYDATNQYDFVVQTNLGATYGSFDTPAYFDGKIYYACSGDNLDAFLLLTNDQIYQYTLLNNRNITYPFPGATPSISANGANNPIVWTLRMGSPQLLLAANANDLTTELYTSGQAPGGRDQLGAGTKFAVPTIADGKVFAGGSNSVAVFGLLGGTFSFSAIAYSAPQANTNAAITVNRNGGTNGAVQVSYASVTGGTAVAGVNYSSVSGVLNWADGESGAKTFSLPVFNDGLADSNLTVNLALSNPTNPASALAPQSTVVLTIMASPTSVWKLAYFGTNANAATAGDTMDPSHDGMPNLLKYAYAFNPNFASTNPFIGQLADKQFQLHFPRNTSASDITYLVQSSDNLLFWSNVLTYTAASGWVANQSGAMASESASNGVPPAQFVYVTATTSTNLASTTNQFLRLEIHR